MSCWKKKKITPSFIRIIYWWSSCQVPSLPTYKKAYLNLIFIFDFISRIITVQPNLCERYLCSNRSINISTLVLWFSSFFAFLSFFFNFFFRKRVSLVKVVQHVNFVTGRGKGWTCLEQTIEWKTQVMYVLLQNNSQTVRELYLWCHDEKMFGLLGLFSV